MLIQILVSESGITREYQIDNLKQLHNCLFTFFSVQIFFFYLFSLLNDHMNSRRSVWSWTFAFNISSTSGSQASKHNHVCIYMCACVHLLYIPSFFMAFNSITFFSSLMTVSSKQENTRHFQIFYQFSPKRIQMPFTCVLTNCLHNTFAYHSIYDFCHRFFNINSNNNSIKQVKHLKVVKRDKITWCDFDHLHGTFTCILIDDNL